MGHWSHKNAPKDRRKVFVEERIRQLASFLVQEPRSQLRGFMSHEIRKTDALGVKLAAGDQAQRIQEL